MNKTLSIIAAITLPALICATTLTVGAEEASRQRQINFHIAADRNQDAATNSLKRVSQKDKTLVQTVSDANPSGDDMPTTLYGYCNFSYSDQFYYGLYQVHPSGLEFLWKDKFHYDMWSHLQGAAYYHDGLLKGYVPDIFFGNLNDVYYLEYDINTGEIGVKDKIPGKPRSFFTTMAYVPSTNEIYGYCQNYDTSQYVFQKLNADDPLGEATVICEVPAGQECTSFCYSPKEDCFYGVNMNKDFIKINRLGVQTLIKSVADVKIENYWTGMVYAPKEDVLYWNVLHGDETASIYKLNPATGERELFLELTTSDQLAIMFTTDEMAVETEAPKAPVILSCTFMDASLSGEIEFTMPSQFNDGTPITSALSAQPVIDNEPYGEAITVQPGANLKVNFTAEEGLHKLGMYVECNGKQSLVAAEERYVGYDTPEAPTNVRVFKGNVRWEAVTAGINSGFIDIPALTYDVYIVDKSTTESTLAGTTSATNYTVTFPDNDTSKYGVKVIAVNHGHQSQPGVSDNVYTGEIYELPVSIAPADAAEAALFTSINANKDYVAWAYNPVYKAFEIDESNIHKGQHDDWLVSMPIRMDAHDYYTLTFEATAGNKFYEEEYLEVWMGSTPEKLDIPVMAKTKITCGAGKEDEHFPVYESAVSVPADGIYYIGIHCVSEPKQYGILLKNFMLSDKGMIPQSPLAPEISATEADATGALKATIKFTFPTHTVAGTEIEASTTLKATATSAAGTATCEGHAGQPGTLTVDATQGMCKFQLRVNNGEATGLVASAQTWCGTDSPVAINAESLKANVSENMLSINLAWDAVTAGAHQGFVNPKNVVYNICRPISTPKGEDWEPFAQTKETTYTITPETQDLHRFAIMVSNPAGSSEAVETPSLAAGPAYELPIGDNFGNKQDGFVLNYNPVRIVYDIDGVQYNGVQWITSSIDSYFENLGDGDSFAIYGHTLKDNQRGRIMLPRFSTKNVKAAKLILSVYRGNNQADISVKASTMLDGKPEEIQTISSTGDHKIEKVSVQLPESLMEKDNVQLYLDFDFSDKSFISLIDDYKVLTTNTDGVETIACAAQSISGISGAIRLQGLAGIATAVYTPDGRCVKKFTPALNDMRCPLAPGIYIVKAGTRTAKVNVR